MHKQSGPDPFDHYGEVEHRRAGNVHVEGHTDQVDQPHRGQTVAGVHVGEGQVLIRESDRKVMIRDQK